MAPRVSATLVFLALLAGCDVFDTRSAEQLRDAAMSAWQRNELQSADKLFQRGVRRSEGALQDSMLQLLISLQASEGDLAGARKSYSQLPDGSARSKYTLATHDLGALEYRAGNFAEAERLFTQVEVALGALTQDEGIRWFRIMNLAHLDLALLAQGKDGVEQHDRVADLIQQQMWPESDGYPSLPPALTNELEFLAGVVRREMEKTSYRHAVDRIEAAVFFARNRGAPKGNDDPECLQFDFKKPAGCVLSIASRSTPDPRPL